jgi:hypothetical protein
MSLPTMPVAWIRKGDRTLLPGATRYVRILAVEGSRVTYADLNTGKGIRTRTLAPNARCVMYPEGM